MKTTFNNKHSLSAGAKTSQTKHKEEDKSKAASKPAKWEMSPYDALKVDYLIHG